MTIECLIYPVFLVQIFLVLTVYNTIENKENKNNLTTFLWAQPKAKLRISGSLSSMLYRKTCRRFCFFFDKKSQASKKTLQI